MQLIHAPQIPALLEGNTLAALDLLQDTGILSQDVVSSLKEDYLFLRRIEHCLQIIEDLQVHSLPRDEDKLEVLARRSLGLHRGKAYFSELLAKRLDRIHGCYRKYLIEDHD